MNSGNETDSKTTNSNIINKGLTSSPVISEVPLNNITTNEDKNITNVPVTAAEKSDTTTANSDNKNDANSNKLPASSSNTPLINEDLNKNTPINNYVSNYTFRPQKNENDPIKNSPIINSNDESNAIISLENKKNDESNAIIQNNDAIENRKNDASNSIIQNTIPTINANSGDNSSDVIINTNDTSVTSNNDKNQNDNN